MERRDFIKCGVCAFSSLLLSGCSQNEKSENKNKKYWLVHVEIPICYHCNLNCAHCDHFSPIAPIYEMPVEVFEKDIKQLSKITDKKIKHMYLIGGEPLLHKNIEQLIKIIRKNFPYTRIGIFTNGVLLNNMNESFWKTCGQNKIYIVYSNYILAENYPKNFNTAYSNAEKHGVEIIKKDDFTQFNPTKMSVKPIYDKEKNYRKCPDRIKCAVLDNGSLYTCCIQGSIKFLNGYFKDKQIPNPQEDVLDIYKISSSREIWEYFKSPKTICAHCGYHVNVEYDKWHPSQRIASEWYKES